MSLRVGTNTPLLGLRSLLSSLLERMHPKRQGLQRTTEIEDVNLNWAIAMTNGSISSTSFRLVRKWFRPVVSHKCGAEAGRMTRESSFGVAEHTRSRARIGACPAHRWSQLEQEKPHCREPPQCSLWDCSLTRIDSIPIDHLRQ